MTEYNSSFDTNGRLLEVGKPRRKLESPVGFQALRLRELIHFQANLPLMYPPHWSESKPKVSNIATLFADIQQNGWKWLLQNAVIQSLDLGQQQKKSDDLDEEEM